MTVGQYRSAGVTLTDAQVAKLQLDSAGNLKTVSAGTGATADKVQGNVAAAAADVGNPVKVGGVYSNNPSTLTSGNRGDMWINPQGAVQISALDVSAGGDAQATTARISLNDIGGGVGGQLSVASYNFNGTSWDRQRGDTNGLVVQPALSSTFWSYAGVTGGITNTTDVAIKAAAGASVRNYISGIQFKNTSATASEIVIKDGSTVIWRGQVSASMTVMDGWTFNPPLKGTANTAVNVAMLTTATATIVNVQGFTGT